MRTVNTGPRLGIGSGACVGNAAVGHPSGGGRKMAASAECVRPMGGAVPGRCMLARLLRMRACTQAAMGPWGSSWLTSGGNGGGRLGTGSVFSLGCADEVKRAKKPGLGVRVP